MKKLVTFLVMVVALSAASVMGQNNWSQFLGPDGDPVVEQAKVPVEWSADKNIAWKVDLPGPGASSPVVYGDKVFLTAYGDYGTMVFMNRRSRDNYSGEVGEKSALKHYIICLNINNGEMVWSKVIPMKNSRKDFGGPVTYHGYASATPVVDDQHVYASFGPGGVFAYTHDGEKVWDADIGSGTHGWGTGSSPVLYKDTVLVNACIESKKLIALNKNTGEKAWECGGMNSTWSTPALMEADGKTLAIISMKNKVLAVDADTGKPVWDCKGIADYIVSTPMKKDGIAYLIGARKGSGLAVNKSGEVLWTVDKGSNVSSPVLHDGHLYFTKESRGYMYCVNAKTGEVVYEKKIDGRPMFYASPVLANGNLYYVSRSQGCYVVAAKPQFELVAHNKIESDNSVWNATPAIIGDKMLIRSGKALYCISQ